jgi:uncharacterized membrane protein YjjP (DUF1212 family)
VRLKRFIANENATRYIQNRLRKIGILQEFFKFIILSFFHALRKEQNGKIKDKTMDKSLMPLLPFFSLSKYINSADWNPDLILRRNET